MERITGNEVKSMMEAYASVYKTEEQEVISEETQELDEQGRMTGQQRAARQAEIRAAAAKRREEGLTIQGKPIRGQGNRELRPQSQRTDQQVSRLLPRKPSGTAPTTDGGTTGGTTTGGTTGGGTTGGTQKPQPKPSPSSNLKPGNPNVVVSPKSGEETKFERRLPTSAELRAAQAARKAATAGGASKKEAEYQAVKAGVGVAKGTVKDPKIAADAARKAELEAIRAKAKADTLKKKESPAPAMRGRVREETELDVFDTIKEYLIGEGATEEEALQQMLTLTDEQRTEIIEGSCGSKKKKKGGYGK
jgi:hypothetical protein